MRWLIYVTFYSDLDLSSIDSFSPIYAGFLFVGALLDLNMICISCSHKWERTKVKEYFSFLSNCPSCGNRIVVRNDMIFAIYTFFKKIIHKS